MCPRRHGPGDDARNFFARPSLPPTSKGSISKLADRSEICHFEERKNDKEFCVNFKLVDSIKLYLSSSLTTLKYR